MEQNKLIHWEKCFETSERKRDLKRSRSGLVDFSANTIDLWFLFITTMSSPVNIPGHTNFTPLCET